MVLLLLGYSIEVLQAHQSLSSWESRFKKRPPIVRTPGELACRGVLRPGLPDYLA